MKTIDAIRLDSKGLRVSVDKSDLPMYTGVFIRARRIGRTWYAEIACDDGETRHYRVKWVKLLAGTVSK